MATTRELNSIPSPTADAAEEQIGEALFLHVDSSGDAVHRLNSGAAIIWYLCDGVRTIAAIASVVSQEFSVQPDVAKNDVISVVEELRALGLLEYVASDRQV